MNKSLIIFVCLLLSSSSIHSQIEEIPADDIYKKFGLSLTGTMSRSGLVGSIGPSYRISKFQIELAPAIKILPSSVENLPFGFLGDLIYFPFPRNSQSYSPFINIEYRLIFTERLCSEACSVNYNQTHDITAGYGFSWKIGTNTYISNAINVGFFIDRAYSIFEEQKVSRMGFNAMINLKLQKAFKK